MGGFSSGPFSLGDAGDRDAQGRAPVSDHGRLIASTKVAQARAGMRRAGPAEFLLSRTGTVWGMLSAISTQSPPCVLL